MGARFEQLMAGGRAYLRESVSRPGAPAEFRLKPVKVMSVERGAAFVEVLDTGNRFVTKFANLEPDMEYLRAQLEKVNARRAPPSNDVAPPAPEPAPSSAWPPRLGEIVAAKAAPPEPPAPEPAPPLEVAKETEVALPSPEPTDRRTMTSRENAKRPRRHFTPEQIAEGVQDILSGMSRSAMHEKHGIYSVTYGKWKKLAEAEKKRLQGLERRAAKQVPSADPHKGINGTGQPLEQSQWDPSAPAQASRLEEDNDRLKGVVKILLEKRPYSVQDMEQQGRALMKAIAALLEVGS
jgi:hypothetical protein